MEGSFEATMLGDKRPGDRHWGGAEFFHANPPTCRVPNTELVGVTQVVLEHSLGQMMFR